MTEIVETFDKLWGFSVGLMSSLLDFFSPAFIYCAV